MNLEHLRFFLDSVRRGSFAAVARDRAIDPSSVSRAIKSLEGELGCALFFRTTRQLSPTEAGLELFDRIEPLIDDLEQATEAASGQSSRPRGTLRILAPVSFAQLNLVSLLPEFLTTYPELNLDLRLTDALLDLVEERIDVAIRLGPLADSTWIARRLAPMRSRICASPDYIARHGAPQQPDELAERECLLLDMPGFGNRWHLRDPRGEEQWVEVTGRLRTSNAIALKQFALAGAGIILQGEWIVGRELAEGSLVDLFPGYEATASSFDNAAWTLRPSRRHVPAKVSAFLDFLHDAFATGPPWARV